ncbi:MAG TPA: hypothetical protein VF532_23980 [Candidatus Angelobacter sp.]
MFIGREVISLALLGVSAILTFLNAGNVCHWMFTGKKSSLIPLIGGISGTLGLLAIPFAGFAKWFWIPLVADLGTIPNLLLVAWHFLPGKRLG